MRVLVIAEDLRISGTSEGQVSRSFIYNLARHPKISSVDLLYFNCNGQDHALGKLNVRDSWVYFTPAIGGQFTRFFEKVWHKIFGKSLIDTYKIGWMKRILRAFDFSPYNRVFVRSTGQSFLTIRAADALEGNEAKTVLYFHDTYPFFWDPGFQGEMTKLGVNAYLEMRKLLQSGFICTSPSAYLTRDLRFLYAVQSPFITIPHQFVPEVFEFAEETHLESVEGKLVIMYHGAIQLGRTIQPFLQAFQNLSSVDPWFKENVLLILRIKGNQRTSIQKEFESNENIRFLDQTNAGQSFQELQKYSSLNLILEPSGAYSNILVGKAPLLASLGKPVFVLGPAESELRHLVADGQYFANATSVGEIKSKLLPIVKQISESEISKKDPFAGYFSIDNFFGAVDKVLR